MQIELNIIYVLLNKIKNINIFICKLIFILFDDIKYKLYIYDVIDLIMIQSSIRSVNHESIIFPIQWPDFENINIIYV